MYKQVEIELSPKQIKSAAAGKTILLSAAGVTGTKHKLYVHPENYKKIMRAKKNNKGVKLSICKGAIQHDLKTHMEGGDILGSIWNGIKSVGNWLKDSGVGSVLADAGKDAIAPIIGENAANLGRKLVKGLTGVGIENENKVKKLVKGSQEAKDKMAALRAKRKSKVAGGSFKLN